jgi:Pectate lyase superfamily protein
MRIILSVLLLIASTGAVCLGATVNVRSHGARGNGVTDDTAAINRAIAKSALGDTLFFPAGTYKISFPPGIVLEPERTYLGDIKGESKLVGTGGYSVATSQYNKAFGITLKYLVFDGGGIRLDGDVVPALRVSVTNCTFQNIVTDGENWTTHMGIYIGTGAEYSHFDHNKFYNIFTGGKYGLDDRDATGIFGYGLSHSTIADNNFDFVNEGVHIFFDKTDGTDVLVSRNRLTRVHRISLEFQREHTNGLIVEDNVVSSPLNPYWLTYGMSIAATTNTGKGIIVQNNTVIADTPLDLSINPKNYYPYGIEVWGNNTIVRNNHVIGLWGIGIGIGGALNMVLEKNLICGKVTSYGKSINQYYGPQPGTHMVENVVSSECPSGVLALSLPVRR